MDGKQAFSKPGTADLPPAYGEVAFDERGARQFLQNNGFPLGFVNAVIRSRQTFAQRYWIVDNSGSMASADGQRLASGAGSAGKLVRCTRWEEAVDMLNFHAALAAALAAPTTFTLLNPPANGAPQTVVVADAQSASTLHTSLAGGPGGGTPLCQAVRNVVTAVLADEHAIRAAGRRVTVVILSDGLPSDGDLALALAPLARLPVWLVVRLCCDEQPVLDFWSKVDSSLEIEMDVLDDLRGEAAECAKMNGWLAYGPPLHRLREWGIQDKLLDFLDERKLTPGEVRSLVEFLFGERAAGLPHPELDSEAFGTAVNVLQQAVQEPFNPVKGRRTPWIDLPALQRALKGGAGCAIS